MGQETIGNFHNWSVIFFIAGSCGLALLAVLFQRFGYGSWWLGRIRKKGNPEGKQNRKGGTGRKQNRGRRVRENRSGSGKPEKKRDWKGKPGKRGRRGMALCLTAAILSPTTSVFADGGFEDDRTEKVSVSVEGTSIRAGFYQDTAIAEFTFREKNFDKEGVYLVIADETGRETRLTFEEGEWEGVGGLGEGMLEMVPYGREPGDSGMADEAEVRWFLDSEAGETEYTEGRTVKIRLRFPKEGCFEIREAVCKDLAGNVSGLKEPVLIVVDRTPPKLWISIPEETADHEGYYDRPVTVWLYLREHNFQPGDVEGLPQITWETGHEGQAAVSETAWGIAAEEGEDCYKLPLTVDEEGAYSLRVSYEDPAGWPLSEESVTKQQFTIDKTPPETGRITAMGESWSKFMEQITFGHYSSKEELVVLEGADGISPVEPLRYICAEKEMTEAELEGLSESTWEEGNSLFLKPDFKGIIYLKVTNYAGLSSYFNSDGLVVENKGPDITLSPQGDVWAQSGIYRGDVELTVSLVEPDKTGVISGLRHASYRLEAERGNGRELLKNEVLLEEDSTGVNSGLRKDWQGQVFLKAEDYDGEKLWFTVQAEDMAGNCSEKSLCLFLDQTAPKITVTYGGEQPQNGTYYNQERVVRLFVEEANFSEERVWILATNTEGVLPKCSEWSHDGNLHSCQVVFAEDGDYTFAVRCEDMAGHVSERKEADFTVDRTPPQVSVKITGEKAGTGGCYGASRIAEIIVEEHNFRPEDVLSETEALLDKGGVGNPEPGEFDSRGDLHKAGMVFEEDGEYRFRLEYTDLAGNRAENVFEETFSIDRTPPVIQIVGLENESANRGNVEARVRFLDKRLVPGRTELMVLRLDSEEEGEYQYREIPGGEGEWVRELPAENFPETEETDGLYLLRAKGVDLAGNRAEKEVVFSVNRFGSVYTAAGGTEGWLGTGDYPYLPEERDVIIREYNVDPVEEFQVALNRNGEISLLSEGKAFSRRKISGTAPEPGWQMYEYRIGKELFEQEGDYEVVLYSKDRAGNKMGNGTARTEEREISFAFSVDKTGPSAILSGAEDGGRFKSDRLVLFLDIRDNMKLQKVEVRTKDERLCYEGETLEQFLSEQEGRIVLSEADDWQTVELYAEDMAGNRLALGNGRKTGASGCMEWKFLVTANPWVQLYKDPLRLLSFLALGALAVGCFLAAKWRWKRRKKKPELTGHSQEETFVIK